MPIPILILREQGASPLKMIEARSWGDQPRSWGDMPRSWGDRALEEEGGNEPPRFAAGSFIPTLTADQVSEPYNRNPNRNPNP